MLHFPFMCRLCLIPSRQSRSIDIFDETNEIPEKIFELTRIKMTVEDGLPQEVCVLCRSQLELSVTFKRQVEKANCMLQDYLTPKHSCSGNVSPAPLITGDPLCEEALGVVPIVKEEPRDEDLTTTVSQANPAPSVWEDFVVKVEDNLVIAEPWPEKIEHSDCLKSENIVTETEQDRINKVIEEIKGEEVVNEKESAENRTIQSNSNVKIENGEAGPCTEDSGEEATKDDQDQELDGIKLNLNFSDHIECSCQFCTENKTSAIDNDVKDNHLMCDLCQKRFESLTLLKRHKTEHGEPLSGEWFGCTRCNKSFPSRKGLHAHQREHTQERISIVRRSSRPSKAPERHVVPHYSCSKCERMYNDKATLEYHEKSHLGISFKCNHCGKKFYDKDILEKHIQSAHLTPTRTRNQITNTRSHQMEKSNSHKLAKSISHQMAKSCTRQMTKNGDRLITRTRGHQCNVCGKSYENRSHLFSHMRVHKSTVHLCEICGKTVSLNAYTQHKRSHLNAGSQEVFQCDLCEKKFNNKISLRTHKNSYHGTLKFTCEICGKQFTTMALMKHHQYVHSGKREHACQICGRAFTLKVTLKSHMRIHTGEMPYSCDNCGRHFTWKTTFRNHVANCNKPKVNTDVKKRTDPQIPLLNVHQIPQSCMPQELPIDYSEEAKYHVPIDYSEEAKYRHFLPDETKYFPAALSVNEEIKYTYQQPINFTGDVKPYSRDF